MEAAAATRLSRERILAASRAIVEQHGLEALSMRRLARELDVWPMSVYRYFRDKDELLDALAANAAGTAPTRSEDASWREQMLDLLRHVRAAMAADTASRLPRAFLTPDVLRLSEAGLAILADAGFPSDEAPGAWRALWSYTFGYATFTLAPTAEEARRRTRSALAALPEEQYPALTGAADGVADAFANGDGFGRGLERLLDGLEAMRHSSGTRA